MSIFEVSIVHFILRQIESFFGGSEDFLDLHYCVQKVLNNDLEFHRVKEWKDTPTLDVLNSIQYPIFLYKLSRELFLSGDVTGAKKIFYLNKVLHSIDLFYEIDLKKNFLLSHSVGSVFSKATYGDFCVYYHGILVGKNNDDRPTLNDGLVMFSGSKIVGNSTVGKNVVVSAGTVIVDQNIPDNVYVFPGKGKKPVLKELEENYTDRYFIK
ncbi:hypothetical protein B6N13_02275 [Marinomonas sp. UCMA 3892]|uniref:hypothetical protein n=1 Tax=Marinomonas sp. UCMA 3892 TaxID=1972585 RepID=UPI00146ECBA0|nr:hypothetical protein [Marinomonas sp. UCMA 3892]NLU96920.1 hypothetical protein [Marinomonas sp. UCMA 3892]